MNENRIGLTRLRHHGVGAEESLVLDPRASLTPAQMVDRKLIALLRSAALPISLGAVDRPRRSTA